MSSTEIRNDPYKRYRFILEVDGLPKGGFDEAFGLDRHGEVAKESSAEKTSGLHKVGDITLKRGVVGDVSLLDSFNSQGNAERRNGSIILTDGNGEDKARWNFVNGWITKWTGPTLNADANDVAIETLEIACEKLTIVS